MNPPSKDETTTPHVSSSHSRAAPRPERYHVPGIVLPTVQTRATTKRYSPLELPVQRVVKVGVGRSLVAAGEPAGLVAEPQPTFQMFGHFVPVAANREHHPGLRMGQDPGEAGRAGREAPGRVRIDRPVPLQMAGF